MPRFFFDIEDVDLQPDGEGVELEGLNAARIAAVKLSGELLSEAPDRFWSVGEWKCTCRDETGLILFVLNFYANEAPAALGKK
jgi:hypothetical protein